METNQALKPASSRSLLVDVVRGLAISLVALGHTDQGVEHRQWWGASGVGLQLERFIYSFHMPAFFFVSGIFLVQSVQKRGPGKFVSTKVSQMIYPWVLWAFLQYLLALPLKSFMSDGGYPWRTFLLRFATGDVLWFLPTIFLAVVLGMLLRKVNLPLLFVLTSAVAIFKPYLPVNFVDRALEHLPFLVAGMWLGRDYERLERIKAPLAGALAVGLGGAMLLVTRSPMLGARGVSIVLGLAGTAMLFLLARCAGRDGFARAMAWTGEASFGVYLLSAYGQGLGRELLRHLFHTTNPYLQVLVPTAIAVSTSAWIYQRRVKLKIDWLFLWPFGRQAHTPAKG